MITQKKNFLDMEILSIMSNETSSSYDQPYAYIIKLQLP